MTQIQQNDTAVSVRIAANFTIEPIAESLTFWLGRLGISADIGFAPYNQVFQQLLEGGMLRDNRGGINLVALDLDAWLVDGSFESASAQFKNTIAEFLGVLRSAGAQGAGGTVLLFPRGASPESGPKRVEALAEGKSEISAKCASIPGWSTVDLARTAALYKVSETRDPFTDELGNIPFTEEMYVAAATAAARWIRGSRIKARKLIVLDCDNTLWQGICGEGPVQITKPYRQFQEFLLTQREAGVLLAIASKNNEDDVLAVLKTPDCLLKSEHFTAWQINWQPKSENLRTLSEELGLALNSFIFLDDNPLEVLEVRNSCPEVLAITLPPEAEAIPSFLDHLWAFDRNTVTEEDRKRASMYEAEKQRAGLGRRALTQEEFLLSLHIEIQVEPANEADFPRISQLTQRTTQFNMTGVIHTEKSLTTKLASPGNECWTVRVRDIFGDYGLVGVIVLETIADSLRVETLLLSCRALGRGVEDRMVAALKRWSLERGLKGVVIPFVPTPRNKPALEFLSRLCAVPADTTESFQCVLPAAGDSGEWRKAAAGAPVAKVEVCSSSAQARAMDEGQMLMDIANHLQTVEAIVVAMRTQVRQRSVEAGEFVAPKKGLEETLARIWSECLALEPIGARDNFFEFGGQSLIATRILTRARAEFGVEMGLTHLFERPTVREMAQYIENVRSAKLEGLAVSAADSSAVH